MKKFIPIALCAVIGALNTGGAAYAESGNETFYPEEFLGDVYEDLGALSDFAVSGEGYAVTDSETVVVLENNRRTVYDDFASKIVALDWADGTYFYEDSQGGVYELPEGTEAEHLFTADEDIVVPPLLYYLRDGDLKIYNKDNEETQTLEDYSRLKKYGDCIYALHAGKITFVEGTETTEIQLKYIDFKEADKILTGNTAEMLKTVTDPKLAELRENSYKTEIDLDKLYKPSRPDEPAVPETYFTAGETTLSAAGETALLLCYTGNAAIISIGGKAYITMKKSVTELTRNVSGNPEFENAAVCTPFDYIYSAAYMCESTKIIRIEFDAEVKVISKVTASVLAADFYKVEYADKESGETVTGFIPCKFLRKSQIKDKPQITTPDPEYTEENLKQTVILIIVVIALILTAIGYLTYIGTAGKKKPKKEKEEKTK